MKKPTDPALDAAVVVPFRSIRANFRKINELITQSAYEPLPVHAGKNLRVRGGPFAKP